MQADVHRHIAQPLAPIATSSRRSTRSDRVRWGWLIRAFRILSRRYADPSSRALNGEGARRKGGRWNRPGTAVAYASPTKALAILEYLANVDALGAPSNLVIAIADFDEDMVDRIPPPTGWNAIGSNMAKAHGELWVAERRSAVLAVPSVVVPGDENYGINSHHPDFPRLRVHTDVETYDIDSRFFR